MERNQTRNELTERLLGRETSLSFISLSEARALGQCSDEPALEWALQAPMRLCADGLEDVQELAQVLAKAIKQVKPFVQDNEEKAANLAGLFVAKNR